MGSFANFRQLDYLDLDDQFSEDERMVRDAVRAWVSERFLPVVMEHFEAGTFPMDLVPELAELGVFGPTTPPEYGGAGLNNVQYGLVCQELERGDSGLRSFVSVQGSLVMFPIFAYGSEEQKRHWLPLLASGKAIGCFGLTEPDFGSNPGGMLTTAVKKGNEWVLNGRKMWITNGTCSDVAIVWARASDGIRGFLVEKGTPGFSAPEQKHKFSLRSSITSELVLQDVVVKDSARLPKGEGLKAPLGCLTQARYGIAWGALGAAEFCWQAARQYVLDRKQFGRPLAANQLVQRKLADMQTEITLGLQGCLRLGRLKDEGRAAPEITSIMKRNSCGKALEIARVARDMHGGNGIVDEFHVIRHMLNLETVNTYEGTHDIHALILGRAQTGISAF